MKKQVFGMAATLFALMLALFAGAYATDTDAAELSAADVYAILYEDGTLVFQYGDTPESGRAVTKTYEVDLTKEGSVWYNERESIYFVDFAYKISPTSTAYWFDYCSNLKRVDNIQNLDTSCVTSMFCMFDGCSSLVELDVSHFDTANVTNMSHMFSGCSSLTQLDVSHFDTAKVENMLSMFSGCSGLTQLDVSHFDTAKVENMAEMFSGCDGLTQLDVSNFNTAKVRYIGLMFHGCSGLTELDVSDFNTAKIQDMTHMFSDCSGLTELDVSCFNTAKVEKMLYMFSGCSALTELDVSCFDTAKVENMYSMFGGCSNLKTIYVSNKFTTASLKYSDDMFQGCVSLIGGIGTRYDENYTDEEYARIDAPGAPGYFTDVSAKPVYAITHAAPENGKLSVTLTNPGAATLAAAYFDASGQCVSVELQSVGANAGTLALDLASGAAMARVMLFDGDSRPLCAAYPVTL